MHPGWQKQFWTASLLCEASDSSACSNPPQQLWPVAHSGFHVDDDDDFQTRLGREPIKCSRSWKWVWIYEYGEHTHQAHETPTNNSSDPFKRLWHNVAKDALPVQKKVVNVWWGPRQQKIRFLTFISDYVLKDESIVQFGPTRIFKRQGSLGWWLDLPGRGFCDCGILFFASFSS